MNTELYTNFLLLVYYNKKNLALNKTVLFLINKCNSKLVMKSKHDIMISIKENFFEKWKIFLYVIHSGSIKSYLINIKSIAAESAD